MKQNYLLPAIQRKLESEGKYISRRILGNPRVTEINDITTQYVKRMGNLFMYDPFSSIYEDKFNHMMDYFLQDSSYIEVDKNGAMQVNLPEYIDSEHDITKKEYLRYKVDEKGKLSRTRERVQTEQSSIQERLEEHSSYDEFGIELQREATEDLTPVEKIRIVERTSNSVYGEGIRTILGMQINLDQVSLDVEK